VLGNAVKEAKRQFSDPPFIAAFPSSYSLLKVFAIRLRRGKLQQKRGNQEAHCSPFFAIDSVLGK
jgi:hypothetical protein